MCDVVDVEASYSRGYTPFSLNVILQNDRPTGRYKYSLYDCHGSWLT